MTSNNTNAYVYFVSYSFGSGTGMTAIAYDQPLDTWDRLRDVSKMIGDSMGKPPVTLVSFQLLSSPTETTDSTTEALRDLHNRLNRALDNAAADKRLGAYSNASVLDTLTGHVREARASLGALINR